MQTRNRGSLFRRMSQCCHQEFLSVAFHQPWPSQTVAFPFLLLESDPAYDTGRTVDSEVSHPLDRSVQLWRGAATLSQAGPGWCKAVPKPDAPRSSKVRA